MQENLCFYYSAMKGGKTTRIFQKIHDLEENDQQVLLIKPAQDTKGEAQIINRLKQTRTVDILLFPTAKILSEENIDKIYDCDHIIVDEAQFLTRKQVVQLTDVVDILEIPVICYGLRTNFRMKFFEGSGPLMEMADKIEEIKTICECGKKATVNMRMISGVPVTTGPDILIGGNDSYKAVCRKCYKRLTHHVAGI